MSSRRRSASPSSGDSKAGPHRERDYIRIDMEEEKESETLFRCFHEKPCHENVYAYDPLVVAGLPMIIPDDESFTPSDSDRAVQYLVHIRRAIDDCAPFLRRAIADIIISYSVWDCKLACIECIRRARKGGMFGICGQTDSCKKKIEEEKMRRLAEEKRRSMHMFVASTMVFDGVKPVWFALDHGREHLATAHRLDELLKLIEIFQNGRGMCRYFTVRQAAQMIQWISPSPDVITLQRGETNAYVFTFVCMQIAKLITCSSEDEILPETATEFHPMIRSICNKIARFRKRDDVDILSALEFNRYLFKSPVASYDDAACFSIDTLSAASKDKS